MCFLEKWQNCLFCLAIGSPDFSITVKAGHAYPPRFYEWIDHLKNEAVSRFPNSCQIQSGISACVMSSECFTWTSLYLIRLKILEGIKFLRLKMFTSNSGKLSWYKFHNCLACEFMAHYACKNAEINLKSTTSNRLNFRIIKSLMDSWGVCLIWFDCNKTV